MHFFEKRARAVSEIGADHPLLEGLPQYIGEEANKDVRLYPSGLVVPDRADGQITLVNAERRFGLGELDVGFPKLLGRPVLDVGAQDVAALACAQPVIPIGGQTPVQSETRRR